MDPAYIHYCSHRLIQQSSGFSHQRCTYHGQQCISRILIPFTGLSFRGYFQPVSLFHADQLLRFGRYSNSHYKSAVLFHFDLFHRFKQNVPEQK